MSKGLLPLMILGAFVMDGALLSGYREPGIFVLMRTWDQIEEVGRHLDPEWFHLVAPSEYRERFFEKPKGLVDCRKVQGAPRDPTLIHPWVRCLNYKARI